MSDKVIFIDRDGVINKDPIGDYIKRWEDFKFMPGAVSSLKKLSDNNFEICIISNQAGIGDKKYPEKNLKEITLNMINYLEKKKVKLNSCYFCLHGKKAGCACRKPKTKLFDYASEKLTYSKSKTFFIGDKVTDVEAGNRYGLKTIMVLTGHGKLDRPKITKKSKPNHIVPSIKEAVDIVLKNRRQTSDVSFQLNAKSQKSKAKIL